MEHDAVGTVTTTLQRRAVDDELDGHEEASHSSTWQQRQQRQHDEEVEDGAATRTEQPPPMTATNGRSNTDGSVVGGMHNKKQKGTTTGIDKLHKSRSASRPTPQGAATARAARPPTLPPLEDVLPEDLQRRNTELAMATAKVGEGPGGPLSMNVGTRSGPIPYHSSELKGRLV